MRALHPRRLAFAAILATGLGMTASAVHGLSDMDRSLQLAAVKTTDERALLATADRDRDCDRYRTHHRDRWI